MVAKDKAIGVFLLIISIIIIVVYGYILFLTQYDILLLKLTGIIAVIVVFGIVAWIGYTLATTPPPKPLEELEKELEEELKRIKRELVEEEKAREEPESKG